MKTVLSLLVLTFGLQSWSLTNSAPAEHSSHRSVVLLKIPAIDTDGSDVLGLCNGTLVSKSVIITAAHCVLGTKLPQGVPLEIEVGEYRYKGTTRLGYFPFLRHRTPVSIRLQPGVSGSTVAPENDFVVITLKNEIATPEGFEFPVVWNQSLSSSQVTQAFVVTVNPIETMASMDTKQGAVLNNIQFLGYSAKSTSTSRVQEGDSGAPLFATIAGKTYLVGVVKGRGQSFGSNWDVFAVWGARY